MTTDKLAKQDWGSMLRPRNLDEAIKFSKIVAGSDLVPADYRNKPHNVLIAIQMGAEVGLAPMQAIQNIAVINGRPSLWGDAMLALVQAHPECEDVEEDDTGAISKNGVATCIVKRKGRKPVRRRFSVDDAKKAQLWTKKGPWAQYPERMLQMRARSWALRDAFPDVLKGLGQIEEARDSVDVGEVQVRDDRAVDLPPQVDPMARELQPEDLEPSGQEDHDADGVVHDAEVVNGQDELPVWERLKSPAGEYKGFRVCDVPPKSRAHIAGALARAIQDPKKGKHREANEALMQALVAWEDECERRVKELQEDVQPEQQEAAAD